MKKIFSLIIAVAAVAMFTACDRETDSPYKAVEANIEIVSTDVVFAPEGGQGSITFTSTGSVTATSDKDWCSVSASSGTVSVTVGSWVDLEPRYALVTLKNGNYSVNVTVQQNGFKSASFPYNSLRVKKEGGLTVFPYEYDHVITAASSESWVAAETSEDRLSLTVAENTTTSPRNASVDWALGASAGTIDVWQYGRFTEQSAWTASYDGEYNYSGTYYSIIAISGVEMYDFFVDEASALDTDDKIEDYILDYIDENLEWAANNGYSPEDLYYDGAARWLYPSINTPGEYKIVVFAVNENYVPTGEWQSFNVKIVDPPSYADFLGKWTLTSSTGDTETWEITEDTAGSSYLISGVNGAETLNNVKVPATYNNGVMEISATRDLGSYTNSSGFVVNFAILGIYINGTSKYRVTPNPGTTYSLATATLNEDKDKFTLTPAARSSSPTGAYMGMQWYGLYTKADGSAGAYYYNNSKYTPLPQEGVKVGDGGNGGGGEGDDKYSKWLGNWTIDRQGNTDTWEIMEKVKGESYTIAGIEGHGESYFGSGNLPVAKFDSTTGNLQLYEQELGSPVTSGGETITVALYGRFVYSNGTTYYDGDGDKLFDAELSADGKSATLTPGGWTYGGTTYPFIDFLYYGFVDNTLKYWWCGGVTTLLPNKLAAATGSSAPKAEYSFSMTKNVGDGAARTSAKRLPASLRNTEKEEAFGQASVPGFAKVIR
mgnify:FL=1